MALRVVTMTELRLEVLLEPQRTGESVAEVCRRREISRQSYYRFKRRYQAADLHLPRRAGEIRTPDLLTPSQAR